MGSDKAKAAGAEGRADVFSYDPDKLVTSGDKSHPLYDPDRAKMPINEAMVLNIMAHGVIQPINVKKNGEKNGVPVTLVVVGNRRVIHTREANRRLKAEGKEPILVPGIIKRGEDADLYGMMVSENQHRADDSDFVQAKKMQKLLDYGRDEEYVAMAFGCSVATVKQKMLLLNVVPEVRKKAESLGVPAMVLKEVAKLPAEEQPAEFAKLEAAGALHGSRGVEAAKRVRKGEPVTADRLKMMPRKRLEQISKRLKKAAAEGDEDCKVARAVVERVLGHERAFKDKGIETVETAFDSEETEEE